MGAPTPSMPQNPTNQPVQQPQMGGKGGGKGSSVSQSSQDQPFANNTTMSATSGQAQMGQPNPYPNTISSWDNSTNQQPPTMPQMGSGKGKGA
jgi:hypothetical protein